MLTDFQSKHLNLNLIMFPNLQVTYFPEIKYLHIKLVLFVYLLPIFP